MARKKLKYKPKYVRPTWDDLFMAITDTVASRSACFPHQIGAVFVDDNHRVVSLGYSGPSVGDTNCSDVGYCVKVDGDPKTGKIKRCNGAHAEMNAIVNSGNTNRLSNSTLYSTVLPCYDCMKILNNLGVKRIVYKKEYQRLLDGGQWKTETEPEVWELAKKRKIKIEKYKEKTK